MKNLPLLFSIILTAILIGGALSFSGNSGEEKLSGNNVTLVDGMQIITITAKGGYYPRVTKAKAGIPTVLKMDTRGTFDCSSALTIPTLGYRKNLPPSGETTIDLSAQGAGSRLQGLCSMGMYHFSVEFN